MGKGTSFCIEQAALNFILERFGVFSLVTLFHNIDVMFYFQALHGLIHKTGSFEKDGRNEGSLHFDFFPETVASRVFG